MSPDAMATGVWHALADPWTSALMRRAFTEIVLVAVAGGGVGCWVVLFELSYGAESLAHALLPGLVLGALVGAPLLLGAGAGIAVAALAIALASNLREVQSDTAIAVVVTALVGLGALLALSPASPPGLQSLLFGGVLGTSDGDLLGAGALVALIGLVLAIAHPRLVAVGFDARSTPALGVSPLRARAVLGGLLALTTLVAVQGLGSLLVLALVIGPAATARRLASRIGPMIALAIGLGVLGGVAGLYLSYYANVAAGPAIAGTVVATYLLVRGATPGYAQA
jgi:ABC-type Mn2+/Zn2+ transport system permease subunit